MTPNASPPQRVQLRRIPGWRKPPNMKKVDRSTRLAPNGWGNQFGTGGPRTPAALAEEAAAFSAWAWAPAQAEYRAKVRQELRGWNLGCWCPLDGACHADTLLAIANGR